MNAAGNSLNREIGQEDDLAVHLLPLKFNGSPLECPASGLSRSLYCLHSQAIRSTLAAVHITLI
jgi:hypothetical protein